MIGMVATLVGVFALSPTDSVARQESRPVPQKGLAVFETQPISDGRVDVNSGLMRAAYGQAEKTAYRSPATFLAAEAHRFGWTNPDDELRLVHDERRARSRHLTYQQTFEGLPVVGRSVRMNLDHLGRVSMVTSAFEPVRAEKEQFNSVPIVEASSAVNRALNELASGVGITSPAELVVLDPSDPRLAWELVVWPDAEPAEYRVWVDARTGAILSWQNQVLMHRHADGSVHAGPHSPPRADGSGFVFDPDPLFTTGEAYGSPYVDNGDATNTALDAARKTVTLRDISQNNDGKWVLEGPHVRIVGRNSGGTTVYTPPAVDGPDDFFFNRADDEFEAVNAYYHIDKSQRYVQALGIADVQNTGLDVNPQGVTRDNSFYFPSQNMIIFGTGGVDDAEDPSVVIHEYGHALLNGAAPGLTGTQEGLALHEGFSDYWQGSYYRHLVESGQTLRDDWRWIFLWDAGEGAIWSGRYLENNGTYPADVCTATSNSCGSGVIYDDGMLWAATLMQIWDQLGREHTDELVLLSHYYLSAPATFADAAQAVIQADTDYFGGANLGLLIDIFGARGLIDASAYGPVINHDPLLSTESSGGTVVVQASVAGVSSEIASVELVYRGRTFDEVAVTMSPVDGSTGAFDAPLVLPSVVDTVFYYIRAEDQIGNITFDPESAPESPHFFVVGVDTESPSLTHVPPEDVSFEGWPARITGEAQDNFGIQSVRLVWSLVDPDGVVVSAGEEVIAHGNGLFDVPFPAELADIENGSRIRYAIEARDASTRENTSRVPVSGMIEREIEVGSVIRRLALSGSASDLTLESAWSIGEPAYGTLTSPGSSLVLATSPDDSYSDVAGSSSATLATLNLARVDDAYLQFWHFFDTEHAGLVDPGSSGGSILDGGVVEYRSESTADWTALTPDGGYPGVIQPDRGNPLAGREAFGGFSYGWRQAVFNLPKEDAMQLRFVFATDNGNDQEADRFAGWVINSIELVRQPAPDATAPQFESLPPQTSIASTQAAPPHIEIIAADDTGIQDMWIDWTMAARGGTSQSSARMTQSQGDLQTYVSVFEFIQGLQPGDVLTYQVRSADPAGNEVTAGPFEVRFRLFAADDALTSVWATGSWEEDGGQWEFSTSIPTAGSAIVMTPRFSETNALEQQLVIDHEASFDARSAGLVEISIDDGNTWSDLVPDSGYPGLARLDASSAINGRRAFIGSFTRMQSRFDLSDHAGQEIQIRIHAASGGEGGLTDRWRLFSVEFRAQTEEDAFTTESEFGLHDAFPNPTDGLVRLSWSVEEAGMVRLKAYDGLGREVATLVESQEQPGTQSLTWDTSGLPSGVYFIRLQSAGKSASKTLVVN